MNKQEFIEQLVDILQLETELSETTNLKDLEEWDSMAYLGVMSLFDMEFGKNISTSEMKSISTVNDLVQLAELSE